MPLRTVATSEFVVPRSMPTARRRWCGSGEAPGSEICSSDIGRFSAASVVQRRDHRVQIVGELDEEPQLANARTCGIPCGLGVEHAGNFLLERDGLCPHRGKQRRERLDVAGGLRRCRSLAPFELALEEVDRERSPRLTRSVYAMQSQQILGA